MSEEQKYYCVPWPQMCEECGKALTADAMTRTDLNAFVGYCPHTHTLTLAYAGDIEGERGIVRWDVESPLTYPEAVERMNKMQPHAAVMENLDTAKLQ